MTKDTEKKKPLSLGGKLELKLPAGASQPTAAGGAAKVRQSLAQGRSRSVQVEVKRRRPAGPEPSAPAKAASPAPEAGSDALPTLTAEEKARRAQAVLGAVKGSESQASIRKQLDDEFARKKAEAEAVRLASEAESKKRREGEETRKKSEEQAKTRAEEQAKRLLKAPSTATEDSEEEGRKGGPAKRRAGGTPWKGAEGIRAGKLSLTRVLSTEDGEIERTRSLASMRRARQKEKLKAQGPEEDKKIIRDVIIPETITVGELANRMAVRGADVIKSLMKMGMMVTISQPIDADTAELIVQEFGHKVKRVTEADIEIGLSGQEDKPEDMTPRPPVVTIMGHVDHGKTSLLDALRETDVVSGEAGGITQHIGAYNVTLANGKKISFIDTPGHEAFSAMRARGANVTDIVVLVVAADDGVMKQTIEAIHHAQAAKAPIIVAINKIDKPGANPMRVKTDLLQHGIATEDMGGEILAVEVSAKNKQNLDKLEEAILLQAEILDLKANPNRAAEGIVIEAKLDRGRGAVATVLVQKGTLKVGQIFVAGAEWGRVRALVDDKGKNVVAVGPGMPVEVLGFQGTPLAGDDFVVVENENRAREVAEFRDRRARNVKSATAARGTLEQQLSKIKQGEVKELPVLVKADVQGSLEAIRGTLEKLSSNEVALRLLHAGVGGITESDVTLAAASNALIIGFNVRADATAREISKRDNIDIRYYSIIYQIVDDMKQALSGLLAPTLREKHIGNAEIREVFNITKVGKIAGCYVTNGVVKRGAGVRLLRDNVVIHEGKLKTLKRFKDEVKEVSEGYECGMAFENYSDIQAKDVIECFETEQIARSFDAAS